MWISVNVLIEEGPYSLICYHGSIFFHSQGYNHLLMASHRGSSSHTHTLGVDQWLCIQSSDNGKAMRDLDSSSFNQPQWGRMWMEEQLYFKKKFVLSLKHIFTLLCSYTHTHSHMHAVLSRHSSQCGDIMNGGNGAIPMDIHACPSLSKSASPWPYKGR
jgi:hypothetical protein